MTEADPNASRIKHRATKWAEGVAALSVIVGMRSCAIAMDAIAGASNPVLRSVLFSGVVVSYARAFEVVEDRDTKTARRFSIRGIAPPFSKTLHQALLALRNEQVAHAGHLMNDYSLAFLRATATIESPAPDGSIRRTVERRDVGTRARASLACGPSTQQGHADLLAHVVAAEAVARQRLAVAIVEHDLASLFRLKQEADEGRSYGKILTTKTFSASGPSVAVLEEGDLAFSLAEAPAALPLAFAVMHFNVLENDGDFSLNERIMTE